MNKINSRFTTCQSQEAPISLPINPIYQFLSINTHPSLIYKVLGGPIAVTLFISCMVYQYFSHYILHPWCTHSIAYNPTA